MILSEKTAEYILERWWAYKTMAVVIGVLGIVVFPAMILWDNRSDVVKAYVDLFNLYLGNLK